MTARKILLLIMRSESERTSESELAAPGAIEVRCKSLCESLNIELEVSILASSNGSADIYELSQGADALMVSNEAYAGSPDSVAVEEFRSFESVAERGIPIVEVHEHNILADGDYRPYLDSPSIGAGLVSGMGLHSYAVAIRALASKLGGNAA
ncbi:MAG: type II 3-dehydroquinate dehydratase [Pseudomonadales bacterium]